MQARAEIARQNQSFDGSSRFINDYA